MNGIPRLTKKERRELRRQEKREGRIHQNRIQPLKRMSLGIFVILGIGGLVVGIKLWLGSSPSPAIPLALDTVSSSDWTKGNQDVKIILIEYSDFQCPACAAYYPFLKQLEQELGNKFLFVYRHFPLPQHKNASLAAAAAEAAGRQGKFWEMHNLIFENQKVWSDQPKAEEEFIKYAQTIGLDIAKFKNDLNSKEIKNKVKSDYQSGVRARVNATPTFFLNGKRLENPRNYEEFKKIIEANLQK